MRVPILSAGLAAGLILSFLPGCKDSSSVEADLDAGRVRELSLELAGNRPLPGPVREALTFPAKDDPRAQPDYGKGRTVERNESGQLIVGAGQVNERTDKVQPWIFTFKGNFHSHKFNQVVVSGIFPGEFELQLQLEGEKPDPQRSQALVTRNSRSTQNLVFDFGMLRGRSLNFQTLRGLVRGSDQPFELHGIELVRFPLHLSYPVLGGEARSVVRPPSAAKGAEEARMGYGLPRGYPGTTSFEVESPEELLAFDLCLARAPSPDVRPPRVEVTLTPEEGEPRTRRVEFTIGKPAWHPVEMPLSSFVGQTVELTFTYFCESERPGLAAVGDLRVLTRGEEPPTVVLISSDTHRADHIAAYGLDTGFALETPGLDELAKRGIALEGAWSSTNVTSPSHVAMMTGLHPRDTRLVTNQDELLHHAHTLAEAFHEAGWRTSAVVSVRHLGPSGTDLTQGFDRVLSPTAEPWSAEFAVGQLQEWMSQDAGLPIFAFLHLFDAHHPYVPPATHDRMYYPKDKDPFNPSLPAIEARRGSMPLDYWGRLRDVDYGKAQYAAEVTYLDGALEGLFASERLRRGLVAFTSDHGEILAAGGTYFNHGEIVPDTLHVPLILSGDALPEEYRGRRVKQPISHLGLGRTLLDLSGLTHVDFPGSNLLGAVDRDPAPLFALSAHGFSASIRRGDYYLLLHLKDHQGTLATPRKKHQVELFHLASDMGCEKDLSNSDPDRTAAMKAELIAWLGGASRESLSGKRSMSPEELAALASLGYFTAAEATEDEGWYQSE